MISKIKSYFVAVCLPLAAACFLFFPMSAAANLEVKSENIIFYGDVKPKDGERLVRNLEIYRAFILSLSGVKNRPDAVPLRIYAFKSGKPLNNFANGRGYAGLYTEGTEGPIFLTVSRGGFKKDKWSSQVALHEYSHHVLHALSQDNYPRWYDEGFANYLSTFSIEGDVITIGAPKVNHGLSMKQGAWMDPDTVLGSIHRYPSTRRIDKFYGQSWLYVHYMQNRPELSAQLPNYLMRLKTQNDSLKAFENAFGLSPQEFHKRARVYWNKNQFPVASFKAAPKLLEHKINSRTLSDAELEFAFAKAKMKFLDKKEANKFSQKLQGLEASMGQNVELYLMISEAAMIGEDYSKAKRYLSKAIKTSEISAHLLRLRADISYHQLFSDAFDDLADNQAKLFQASADLDKSIRYFEEALMLDENNRTTNMHLLSLLGRSKVDVSEAGQEAVERSYNSFLKPNDIGQYINVANVLARTNQKMRACDNYRYIKGRVEGYEDKGANDDFARFLKFEQEFPQICE